MKFQAPKYVTLLQKESGLSNKIANTTPESKYLLRFPVPLNFISKSIVGTTPNTNNILRYPTPIFKPSSKSIIGATHKPNNHLRPSSRPPTQPTNCWIYYAIQLRLLI